MTLTNLPHLDALRALAVSIVVLFHLDVPGFEMGYLGVDIFFVLSGYLMTHTMLIRKEMDGRFKLGEFFLRRIKRIVPSLLITILASGLLAFVLMSPQHLADTAKQGFYALFFGSNFLFYNQAGYFAPENSTRILLHTWSLSVEEQFYMLFGFMLWLGNKTRFSIVCCIVAVASLLLAVSAYWEMYSPGNSLGLFAEIKDLPAMVFYLAPFRVFQFSAGILIALLVYKHGQPKSDLIWMIGIAAFLACAIAINVWPPAKNMSSMLVMFGVTILLLKNPPLSALGAQTPVRFLARISYQVYLVHWAIIVGWKYWTFRDLNLVEKGLLLFASILLGWMLYLLSLKMLRAAKQPRRLGYACLGLLLPCGLIQSISYASDGADWRIPAVRLLKTPIAMRTEENEFCGGTDIINGVALGANVNDPLVTCSRNRLGGKAIYVLGDSHARHLIPGLSVVFPDHSIRVMYFTSCLAQSGHLNYIYSYEGRRKLADACIKRNLRALRFFEKSAPTNILIHQYSGYEGDETSEWYASAHYLINSLTAAGHKVHWIGSVVRPGKLLIDCLSVPIIYSDSYLQKRCRGNRDEAEVVFNKNSKLTTEFPNYYINVNDFFCSSKNAQSCSAMKDGLPLFRDKHHLNLAGSTAMIRQIYNQLDLLE